MLFTAAKTWKQPKCPSTQEQIKMWYIYTMEYYAAVKNDSLMPFAATEMDPEMSVKALTTGTQLSFSKDTPSFQSQATVYTHAHISSQLILTS